MGTVQERKARTFPDDRASFEIRDGLESGTESQYGSDDAVLARMGYKSEMLREFGNLSTISFAFSIMGMTSSIATTFNTPLLYGGGPASVVWCWFGGSIFNMTIGLSVAELISAYPTSGGLYTASASLVPQRYRAIVGWVSGYLNLLGQIAGVASTEFGLSQMIWAAVVVGKDGDFVITQGMQFGLFIGLLVIHGILNSLKTRDMAVATKGFVFINLGSALVIVITLLAKTGRSNMHTASYVFTDTINATGWSNNGLAFLFGLLSVQWTMTDYDAVAHIAEEVRRVQTAAPIALIIAVAGTGIFGWLLNVVLVLCSGDIADLPGPSGLAFLTIMANQIGKVGSLVLWPFVCLTAFFTVQTALQACGRTVYALSRDGAFPDRGFFGRINKTVQTPVNGVWLVVIISAAMGSLYWASLVAVYAIFSLCAVALDLSYVIPVLCKLVFANHPEVQYKPGPFNMGRWGYAVNVVMIVWTAFEVTILAWPTVYPVDKLTMNYSSIIAIGVMLLSAVWYVLGGRKHYAGPRSNLESRKKGEEIAEAERLSQGASDEEVDVKEML